MSTFRSLTASEAADIILGAEDPAILIHVHPDADTVGTAAALADVFSQLGRTAAYVSSDDIPSRLAFIIGDVPRVHDCRGRTVISVDVASPKQGGCALEGIGSVALMIDHHGVGEAFADHYTLPDASSAAEVLVDIIDELIARGRIAMTKKTAAALFAAISSDTGGFRFSSATPKTFRIAARLIETGIDHADISHKLFFSKTIGQIRAEGFISSRTELFAHGRIAVACHTKRDRELLGLCEEDFDCAIDTVRSIAGVETAVLIRETDTGDFKASLRSVGQNVAEVARMFGGGGHVRAAGCTVSDARNISDVAEAIRAELEKGLASVGDK